MGNADKLSAFKQKQRERLAREAELLAVLTRTGKTLELDKREKKRKKRTVDELLAMIDMDGVVDRVLRPEYTYIPTSHNLDKQVAGLISHLFVQYPVPSFLYTAFQPPPNRHRRQQQIMRLPHFEQPIADVFEHKRPLYRTWFVTLSQGGSFSKLVKGVMTSKEAYVFLSAPPEQAIHENVWWARMRVAGIPGAVAKKLVERLFSTRWIDDPDGRWAEVIQFYARFHAEMDRTTFSEIADFIDWKLTNDAAFRMKGRTLGSVVKLTNEWHLLIQKARLGAKVDWSGFGITPWEHESYQAFCEALELRSNTELMNEGRKQNHCVYSYVDLCLNGRSSIFSMRWYRSAHHCRDSRKQVVRTPSNELSRLTIEVNNSGRVVQVRGPMNRPPTPDEQQIVKLWAGEKGFTLR